MTLLFWVHIYEGITFTTKKTLARACILSIGTHRTTLNFSIICNSVHVSWRGANELTFIYHTLLKRPSGMQVFLDVSRGKPDFTHTKHQTLS